MFQVIHYIIIKKIFKAIIFNIKELLNFILNLKKLIELIILMLGKLF